MDKDMNMDIDMDKDIDMDLNMNTDMTMNMNNSCSSTSTVHFYILLYVYFLMFVYTYISMFFYIYMQVYVHLHLHVQHIYYMHIIVDMAYCSLSSFKISPIPPSYITDSDRLHIRQLCCYPFVPPPLHHLMFLSQRSKTVPCCLKAHCTIYKFSMYSIVMLVRSAGACTSENSLQLHHHLYLVHYIRLYVPSSPPVP